MSKLSRAERLKRKRAEIKSKSSGGNILYLKEGTIRVRILPVDEEDDFVQEVTQFYLGSEIKGVYSPSTFGKPCAIMEKYEELRNSGDEDDKDLAKGFSPKQKYLAAVVLLDDKGKKIDKEKGVQLVQLTGGLYQSIIDLYLDEDEWGDMTDPVNGYDLKLTRTGSTMTDTEYSVSPCKNTAIPDKAFHKVVDVQKLVEEVLPSYDETLEKITQYLGTSNDDDEEEEEERPKRRPLKKKKVVKRKREI